MHLRTVVLLFLLTALLNNQSAGQPITVKVWPHGAPGEIRNAAYREDTVYTEKHEPRIRHVTDPELYVYLPKERPCAAVVICPGGGYGRLAMDHEGHDVEKWLNSIGVAGIILKYRLPSDTIMKEKSVGPLQDIQEAIRIVRRNAAAWKIEPKNIGVMGFSAGGHLAASASTMYGYRCYKASDTTSGRPDFSLLIYGVISMQTNLTHPASRENLLGSHPDTALVNLFSAELHVDKNTPPGFLVHAADDKSVPSANSIRYFEALQQSGVPAELHVYQEGGHGFGLGKNGGTESDWPEACERWMRGRGILK